MGKLKKVILGMGIFLCGYPIVNQLYSHRIHQDVIQKYQNVIEATDDEDIRKYLKNAQIYNENLHQLQNVHMENYEEYELLLNPAGNGMIGVVEIPKISLQLPIYHGTAEDVMEEGIGHLYKSSLPVGGDNTHSILTGHRGLPNAELFTRLGELETDDLFLLHVCGQTFTYQVRDIKVIEPDETEGLGIQQGRDLVSLITCTPYGINTHRLVVTGERMEEKNIE